MDTHSNLKIHSVHRKQRNYVSNYLFLPLSVGVTLKRVQESCDKKCSQVVEISCAFRTPSLRLTCPLSCRSALQCLSQRLLKTVRKRCFAIAGFAPTNGKLGTKTPESLQCLTACPLLPPEDLMLVLHTNSLDKIKSGILKEDI